MRRYIDADGFFETFEELDKEPYTTYPASEVRENVRGEWIDFSMSIKGVPTEACGVCGEWSLGIGKNFCPNCGADMRGETYIQTRR